MTQESRENMMRAVYPTIVQSVEDKYCVINGEKEYNDRYDRYMLLVPHVTVEGLREGDTLLYMIEHMGKPEGLFCMTTDLTLKLRKLVEDNNFPLTDEEKSHMLRELQCKIDQILMVNTPGEFGKTVKLQKPEAMQKGSGEQSKLYEKGWVCYQCEFLIVLRTVNFVYSMVAALLDEFRSKVLGKHAKRKVAGATYQCLQCGVKGGAEGVRLMQCSKCNIAAYCSR